MSSEQPELEESASEDTETGITAKLQDGLDSTRRKFLVTNAAVWTSASLAGCGGQGQEETTTAAPTTTTPEPPKNFVVTDDMIASGDIPAGATFAASCAPTRKFVPGMHAVWKVGVYDPATGEQLTNDDLDGVTVEFTNRDYETVALQWAGDDEEHPHKEWNGSLAIPEGAKPGTVKYDVKISNGDDNYQHVGVAANEFEIIEYTDEVRYVVSNYTYAVSSPEAANGFVSACGPEWQFAPGMKVAFAANIFDADTGKEPGPDVIKSATVTFPNGEFDDIDLAWQGDAEEHAEKVWDGVLKLPDDAAPGTYTYKITVAFPEGEPKTQDVSFPEDTFTVVNPNA